MIESSITISPDDVAGHYDDLDEYYRLLWGEHLHHGLWETGRESSDQAITNLIEHCAGTLQLSSGDRVCDVGCGYGGTSRHLAEKHQLQVTGLTISEQQYEYASSKLEGADNPKFLLRNWEQNNLDPEYFDGIISIECIAHVPDKQRYFAEVMRVLKPGARAAITHWMAAESAGKTANKWLLEPICREGRLPGMGDADDYRKLAEQAGLTIHSYEDLTKKVRKTWAICLWRVFKTIAFTPRGWKFLFSAKSRHAVFIFSVARILIAYYVGSMKYGFFVFEKPSQ